MKSTIQRLSNVKLTQPSISLIWRTNRFVAKVSTGAGAQWFWPEDLNGILFWEELELFLFESWSAHDFEFQTSNWNLGCKTCRLQVAVQIKTFKILRFIMLLWQWWTSDFDSSQTMTSKFLKRQIFLARFPQQKELHQTDASDAPVSPFSSTGIRNAKDYDKYRRCQVFDFW